MNFAKIALVLGLGAIGAIASSTLVLFKRTNNLEKDNIQLMNCLLVIDQKIRKLTEYPDPSEQLVE